MQHLVRRLELVVLADVVDVVDGLLEVVGGVLDLLQFPRVVTLDARADEVVLRPLDLEADILQEKEKPNRFILLI